MLAYLYYHTNVKPIPYSYSVPMLLLLSAIGSFLSAAVYNVTIGKIQYKVLLKSFLQNFSTYILHVLCIYYLYKCSIVTKYSPRSNVLTF